MLAAQGPVCPHGRGLAVQTCPQPPSLTPVFIFPSADKDSPWHGDKCLGDSVMELARDPHEVS